MAVAEGLSPFVSGQLRSYMRTPVAFVVAQALGQQGTPALVVGTGNYDEDGILRYFCKAGDGVADIQLIADLHKSEVFTVGALVGVPQSVLVAPPSADLWDAQTDEEELGFSYDFVELYTERLLHNDEPDTWGLSPEAMAQFRRFELLAHGVFVRNAHKAQYPLNINSPKYEMHAFIPGEVPLPPSRIQNSD
eukprot:gnl/Ergobibamus_cyprinoides/7.p2 GENE.gnl/Ergobibamus_cyprinoides/7~~gnl/Ergobibamus_cyprinoides/7.p2  ORF type:complete len:192 (+),score=56.10 gnl/Ergobibamus_cyprinoides/7:875-1450(+)